MDLHSYKILKTINKYSDEVDIDIISDKVNIPKDDFVEIVSNLHEEGYLKFPKGGFVETTNKGKTFISNCILSWLSKNIISILALIVSVIALIRTF